MNEELILGGVKYISAKRAADVTKYSKDYVGQLCREGKILASRVGRNWYVAEKSIIRHKAENKTENDTDLSAHADLSASDAQADIPVASQVRNDKETRLLDSLNQEEEKENKDFSQPKKRAYSEPLATYQPDDRPILPQLKRDKTEDEKESPEQVEEYTVKVNVVDTNASVPTKYISKKPVPTHGIYVEKAIVASLFIAVSFGLFMSNSDYSERVLTGISELSTASAINAFNQTAEFVSKTVDDTIYGYLYEPLLND